MMGFFNGCAETLLHLLTFSPFARVPFQQTLSPQALPLDDITIKPSTTSPGFQCQYPAMPGWKSCNGPDSRGCWLQDSNSGQQFK